MQRLLAEAEEMDASEDSRYGKGRGGDEIPEELRFKQSRLAKIKEAKEALEREVLKHALEQQAAYEKKRRDYDSRPGSRRGRPPKPPSDKPDPKAQRNFTDPDSRIMKMSATKSFEQCYNCQAAVDEAHQVILAPRITQYANDKRQVKPVMEKLKSNLDGATPKQLNADSDYYSKDSVTYLTGQYIDAYVATGKWKHTDRVPPAPRGRIPKDATVKQRMARKLRTIKGQATYSKRKQIVEQVFGQIKQVRGFRQFLLQGFDKVSAEWELICLGLNLMKLFRNGWKPATT